MPQDLPGFYYDVEKNRYFPIKGPIPGSARASSSAASKPSKVIKLCRKNLRTPKLLQARELFGNLISSNKGKCNFKEEFRKKQVSHPKVWKYFGTEKIGDSALERIHVDMQMQEGQIKTEVLLTGGINGSLSFSKVGKVRPEFDHAVQCVPDCVWPIIKGDQTEFSGAPEHIRRDIGFSFLMSSNISCIKAFRKNSPFAQEDDGSIQHALISTLGSETYGGSLCLLNLSEPLDFNPAALFMRRRIREIANFDCTIWTADCGSNENRVVIGTNMGAALVDTETGMASWVLHSKSDVLAQQLVHSGNVVLCGLRNGAIVTVDVREKRDGSARLVRHSIPQLPLGKTVGKPSKRFKDFTLSSVYNLCLSVSISSLVSLVYDDQYFLASSMDGSVKLYDHRLCQRGAVQSYEGLVNSHTRIQLGVDPLERFVMSGGEDCYLRLWSIKSGELLFQEKFSDTVLSTVCWQRRAELKPSIGIGGEQNEAKSIKEYKDESSSIGAWLGSQGGLFYMQ
ncbi:Guanine nucleotide-binding protein, beta subunit [Parasponia andersonii]|uniref:Guanine nucleotide-binding protein, beta subunit n=1 Tax=Parasponia andersonii TaxID=3476 RepID=A0A2P5B282_PARAD|nr:Guanine nucleotide-binding protein, beta subunit [Parasponia andersonii]